MEFRRAHTSLSAHSLYQDGCISYIIQVEAGFPTGETLKDANPQFINLYMYQILQMLFQNLCKRSEYFLVFLLKPVLYRAVPDLLQRLFRRLLFLL